jgi:hypothetical protein
MVMISWRKEPIDSRTDKVWRGSKAKLKCLLLNSLMKRTAVSNWTIIFATLKAQTVTRPYPLFLSSVCSAITENKSSAAVPMTQAIEARSVCNLRIFMDSKVR